jgi:hypothetical protein
MDTPQEGPQGEAKPESNGHGCWRRDSTHALKTALTVGKLILLAEHFEATKTADPSGKVLTSQPLNHCSYGVSTSHYDILSVSLVLISSFNFARIRSSDRRRLPKTSTKFGSS